MTYVCLTCGNTPCTCGTSKPSIVLSRIADPEVEKLRARNAELERQLAEANEQIKFWASHAPNDEFCASYAKMKVRAEQAEQRIEEAVKAERGACAAICDGFADGWGKMYKEGHGEYRGSSYYEGKADAADYCSAAIRARGEK